MLAITAPLKPFDDADLARLDHLLWDHVAANGGMNLEAGWVFSAMFAGPIEVLLEHLIARSGWKRRQTPWDTIGVSEIKPIAGALLDAQAASALQVAIQSHWVVRRFHRSC